MVLTDGILIQTKVDVTKLGGAAHRLENTKSQKDLGGLKCRVRPGQIRLKLIGISAKSCILGVQKSTVQGQDDKVELGRSGLKNIWRF